MREYCINCKKERELIPYESKCVKMVLGREVHFQYIEYWCSFCKERVSSKNIEDINNKYYQDGLAKAGVFE